VHIVKLSIAVVEVDTKVINASLTQNQCLQRVTPPLTHVEIPRSHEATELNNDGVIKLGDIHYQTEPNLSIFSARQHICYSALYAIARLSVCLSVCPSVTRVDQSKTFEVRITQLSPQSSPMTSFLTRNGTLKFQREDRERGRQIREGYEKYAIFSQ